MTASPRSTLTWRQAACVTFLCFGVFIWASLEAVQHGFPAVRDTTRALLDMLCLELLLGGAAIAYLRWIDFGLPSLLPRPNLGETARGIGLLLVSSTIAAAASFIVFGPTDTVRGVEFLATVVPMWAVLAFSIINGTFEEVFLLGVLLRGLRQHGLGVAIGVSLLVRVLYHLYQGPAGAVSIAAWGLVITLAYARRPALWPVVFCHILADVAALALIG